jgi:hypothetical protein
MTDYDKDNDYDNDYDDDCDDDYDNERIIITTREREVVLVSVAIMVARARWVRV